MEYLILEILLENKSLHYHEETMFCLLVILANHQELWQVLYQQLDILRALT